MPKSVGRLPMSGKDSRAVLLGARPGAWALAFPVYALILGLLSLGFESTDKALLREESSQGIERFVPVPPVKEKEMEVKLKFTRKDFKFLALNDYFEARSQGELERRAIAHVVLNRVRSRMFPDSIYEVITDGTERGRRCDFSWNCDRKSDRPRERGAWVESQRLTWDFLNGFSDTIDPTGGALFYHHKDKKPKWAQGLIKKVEIGAHIFYGEKKKKKETKQAKN